MKQHEPEKHVAHARHKSPVIVATESGFQYSETFDDGQGNKFEINPDNFADYVKFFIDGTYNKENGFIEISDAEIEKNKKHNIFLEYSETHFDGIAKILQYLDINPKDIFMDLGCGINKVGMQVLLCSNAREVYGIEANDARYHIAEKMAAKIQQECAPIFQSGERKFSVLHQNFLEADLSKATVLFVLSKNYNDELMNELAKIVNKCPHIKNIVTMQPINSKVAYSKTIQIKCNWGETDCHLYGPLKLGKPHAKH